jgi:hypothetical protein
MLAVAWKDEDQITPKDQAIRGIVVGQNEVTMNELWATTPKTTSGRI